MSDMETEQTKRKAAAQPTPPAARAKQKTELSTVFTDGDKEIARYLDAGKNIDPVSLPHLDKVDSYPAYALDAASGAGKTQQAFTFLAGGYEIVYMLCSVQQANSQEIYKAMQHAVPEIRTLINAFARYAKKLQDSEVTVESLMGSLDTLTADTNELTSDSLRACDTVARLFYRCIIKQDNNSANSISSLSRPYKGRGHINVPFSTILEVLKGKILFVDEAVKVSNDEGRENTLRLIRNLSRALGLRTIMAGTAAALTNMVRPVELTRNSLVGVRWMECCLFWQPMKHLPKFRGHLENPDEGISSILKKQRPLILLELEKHEIANPGHCFGELLEAIGSYLEHSKETMTEGCKFHWFSGAWLEGDRKVPSAFNTKAPELVKGHFFEPAITVVSGSQKPYLGSGIALVERLTSPRRFIIDRYTLKKGRKPCWSITNVDQADGESEGMGNPNGVIRTKDNTSITLSFSQILGSLTSCVQQCLVREPLLAVALSFSHKLSPTEFKDAIASALHTTVAQHTVGCVSGEINEHICFAALQLASLQNVHTLATADEGNSKEMVAKRNTKFSAMQIKPFLASLFGYLAVQSDEDAIDKRDIKEILPAFHSTSTHNGNRKKTMTELLDEVPDDHWKNKAESITVPNLIPASAKDKLATVVKKAPHLLGGLPIAGFVPGMTNARLDARAYEWKDHSGNDFKPCWIFEFKSSSKDFSVNKAMKELEAKCDSEKCHALVIAVRPEGKSGILVGWKDDFLRIAVAIQTAV